MTLQLGSHGPLVSRWTQKMLSRFKSYALGVNGLPLVDDSYFGYDEEKVQKEYERRTFQLQDGKVSDADLLALGLVQPVIFTVEGHGSNMWFGPAADNGKQQQVAGRAYWQPVWYDWVSLPFNNKSGVASLAGLLGGQSLPDGTPFPTGTPWGIIGFSQGAMVVSDFLEQQILTGPLNWRLASLKRSLCLGNPRREIGKCAPWADDPPPLDTGGIMIHREFVTTGTPLEAIHQENANKGDMFAENTNNKAGWDKEAIAKIITENSWFGSDAAIFARLIKILGNPLGEAIPALMATISAIKFAVATPNPHYGTVAEPGDLQWMAGVAA